MTIFGLYSIENNLCGGQTYCRIQKIRTKKKYVSKNNTIILIEDDKIEKQMVNQRRKRDDAQRTLSFDKLNWSIISPSMFVPSVTISGRLH